MYIDQRIEQDLQLIAKLAESQLLRLKGCRIFITGGTGFMGKWIVQSLIYANEVYRLGLSVTLLTRDARRFQSEYPAFANSPILSYIEGDVCSFTATDTSFDYIIHAATEASAKLNVEHPLRMTDVVIEGTRRVLDFAKACAPKGLLFLSSGAVYGKQPDEIAGFSEAFTGGPDPLAPGSAYAEAKRMAELMCATYCRHYDIRIPIARCFAFVGPYLPLDAHFAIGNFIRNGIENRTITITGDGTPLRSYQYASDMVVWLFTLLLDGKGGEAYNVGASQPVSIKELAYAVQRFFPELKVEVLHQTRATDRNQNYVPDTSKIKSEFGLQEIVSLEEAIRKTIAFHQQPAGG